MEGNGDRGFVHVPGGIKHAWKNESDQPVEGLITTTAQLGKFFREVGRPVTPGQRLPPPTPEELEHFTRLSLSYDHWLGSPEENAALGIPVFG